MDILTHLPELLVIGSIISLITMILCITDYKKKSDYIKNLVNKCVECTATIIQPVSTKYTAVSLALSVFSGFQIIWSQLSDYTTSEVLFHADGKKIQTFIIRRTTFRMLKFGEEIKICYDPDIPERAFAKNIKKIILDKPLKECIYSVVIT
nr:hypothetical protein [Ruminococcus sp.]